MPDQGRYDAWLSTRQDDWESRCRHCGTCCGAFDDPCRHLDMTAGGSYRCLVYPDRFGVRQTVGGQAFICVHIRQKLGTSWPGDAHCGYKKGTA
ncbi:MAG: hypothetical protein WCI27_02700 [Candidatus Omnitrophota bacterium]